MVGLLTISVLPAACSLDLTSMSSTFVASGTFVPKTNEGQQLLSPMTSAFSTRNNAQSSQIAMA